MHEVGATHAHPLESTALSLVITAPGSAQLGEPIDITVTIPGSPATRGSVDLAFDPSTLVFEEASSDAELLASGLLRLFVEPGIASPYVTDIRFRPVGRARGEAKLHASRAELESEDRQPLSLQLPPPIRILLE
jgi:hypothetical protein